MRRFMLGLSQAQLAEKAGLSRRMVGLLERGVCRPRRRTAERIAEALDSDPEFLFSSFYADGPASPCEAVEEADVTGRHGEG